MKTQTKPPVLTITVIWIIFNSILFILSFLPHWGNITSSTWLNNSVYFLMALICFFIFLRDSYTKDVFLNLSILFFFYSLTIITIFTGDDFLFGNNRIAYFIYAYKRVVLSCLLLFSTTYITLKYILRNTNKILLYFITFVLSSLVIFICFRNYILDIEYVLNETSGMKFLYMGAIGIYLLSILSILIYGIFLYKFDRPNGEYINPLMMGLLILNVMSVVDSFFHLYERGMFSVSLFILFFNLFIMLIILMRKLIYTYSAFGFFYEGLIFADNHFNKLKIKRKGLWRINFLKSICEYCQLKKKYYSVVFIALSALIMFLHIPLYIKINIFMFTLCFLFIFIFYTNLYQKRLKNGNLITK